MAAPAVGSKSLKEYLKKYESNNNEEKRKKKKKKQPKPQAPGVLVVDEDPVWQKPVIIEEENGDGSSDEEKPQVDEDIDVKRMKRLELLRSSRPYHALSEDGSGWVSLSPKRLNNNYDTSPPRRQRVRNDTPEPEPGLKLSNSDREFVDLSPPRERSNHYDTPSPEHDVLPAHATSPNSDISPPHKRKAGIVTSHNPTLKSLQPEDEDNAPSPLPQQQEDYRADPSSHVVRYQMTPDLSPPRRGRHDSPYHDNPSASIESDLSPPRKSKKDVGKLGNLSPSHSHQPSKKSSDSQAPFVSNLSPPRKKQKESILDSAKDKRKTGLISGKDIKEEIDRSKKDDWLRFKQMDPSMSGRGAEPVYRDKIRGERITKDEYLKSKQKVEEKPKEKKLEWGKGLAQKREADARLQELELEKSKPFARTRDDPELDDMLKERIRWGDPMAHLVKKKYPEPVLPNLGENERMKESGFIIPQEIPSHSWLKRGLDAAPNRYGIRPGRHWDGVDRSNGFEKELFKRMNEKKAKETEAYLWSVSDM